MGRPKNRDLRDKRRKHIVLTPRAYELMERHRDRFPHWDFSAYVSNKLIADMEYRTQKEVLVQELRDIEQQRDKINAELQRKTDKIVEMLRKLPSEENYEPARNLQFFKEK